jgi:TonB family protein
VTRERPRNVLGWTWAASSLLHVALIGGFGWLALRSVAAPPAPTPPRQAGEGTVAIELPGVAEGTLVTDHQVVPEGDPPKVAGGVVSPELDDRHLGRGGAPRAAEDATNLSDRDEHAHLTQDLLNRLDRDQQQRLRTSRDRQSWEDRRSSKDPMEMSFLASGDGTRAARRAPSPVDPSRGAARPDAASARGGAVGISDEVVGAPESGATLGADREGAEASVSGQGVRDGRAGADHRASARVMRARPDVVVAAVSIPAARRGRPRDDVDSDQEVARTIRSIVHASTAAGARGEGTGGVSGEGDPGADGRAGAGTRSRPFGAGDEEWWDFDTTDPRLLGYFRRIHGKIDPLWRHAFPTEAALDLRQGVVVLSVTIAADGAVAVDWPPARPSGVPAFDRNCYDVVRGAGPFDPIPKSLGVTELHVRMPFDARNPVR